MSEPEVDRFPLVSLGVGAGKQHVGPAVGSDGESVGTFLTYVEIHHLYRFVALAGETHVEVFIAYGRH